MVISPSENAAAAAADAQADITGQIAKDVAGGRNAGGYATASALLAVQQEIRALRFALKNLKSV